MTTYDTRYRHATLAAGFGQILADQLAAGTITEDDTDPDRPYHLRTMPAVALSPFDLARVFDFIASGRTVTDALVAVVAERAGVTS